MTRKLFRRLEAEADKFGASLAHETRGRHARITVTVGERSRFVTVSLSPSDQRAELNIIGDVRRALREIGGSNGPAR